jgi:hypothetical protein
MDGDPVVADGRDRGLDLARFIDRTAVDRRQAEPAPLIETQRVEVVVAGDEEDGRALACRAASTTASISAVPTPSARRKASRITSSTSSPDGSWVASPTTWPPSTHTSAASLAASRARLRLTIVDEPQDRMSKSGSRARSYSRTGRTVQDDGTGAKSRWVRWTITQMTDLIVVLSW